MSARPLLPATNVESNAMAAMQSFHANTVKEVEDAVKSSPVVVVGMKQNPVVKKVRKVLDAEGVSYRYLEYGSYMSEWKRRLAIKMWSGWPTFPQVFVNGTLIGGCADTEKRLADGTFKKSLGK